MADQVATEFAAANAMKELGNDALKAKDLPLAIEKYEEALNLWQKALLAVPQNKSLSQNDKVLYDDAGFGIVETCDVIFQEFHIQDLCTGQMVKHKVGKYEDVVTKFKRTELAYLPQDLFDLRLAILQNLSLVALKLARASKRKEDFEEVVKRANEALLMNGTAAKASMRKGEALFELKDMEGAMRALAVAQQETKGRDEEVVRLLQQVLAAKGKGKGKGRGKAGKGTAPNLRQAYNRCPPGCPPGCDIQHPQDFDVDADDSGSVRSSSDEEPIIEDITEPIKDNTKPSAPVTSSPQNENATKENSQDDEEVKQVTLAKALMREENRDTATVLVVFAVALAVVPVGGLLACEISLRHVVEDSNTRWLISGAVAVLLVIIVLIGYMLYCFREGFQHKWGSLSGKQEADSRSSAVDDVANSKGDVNSSSEDKKDR
jgi:hypothetical protein